MAVDCKLTGLSGIEIYCMRLQGLTPSGVLIGNSIQSMGFLGGVRSAFRGIVGGEIPDVTNMIRHQDLHHRTRIELGRNFCGGHGGPEAVRHGSQNPDAAGAGDHSRQGHLAERFRRL